MTDDAPPPPPTADQPLDHPAASGSAGRPGSEAEALVTARRLRELRETTGQHGEQLASIGEQLVSSPSSCA
jgi:hypothetical protein